MRRPPVLAVFLSLVSAASVAHATPVTWEFDGIVRVVSINGGTASDKSLVSAALGALGGTVGTPVSGFIRFDPEVFPSPIKECVVSLSGASLSQILVGDGFDSILIATTGTEPGASLMELGRTLVDPTGLFRFIDMSLELTSQDPFFFTPGVIPIEPPALSALDPFGLDTREGGFGYGTNLWLANNSSTASGTGFVLRAELTSLVRVPEPGSAVLVIAALLVLFSRR